MHHHWKTWLWLPAALLTGLVKADAFVPHTSSSSSLDLLSTTLKNNNKNHIGRRQNKAPRHPSPLVLNNDNDGDRTATNNEEEDEDSIPSSIPRGGGGGGGVNVHSKPPPLPTWRDYQKFALPCLGLWVAQPLLSLVDTAFVGLSGDAGQSASNLAALGPATTFFDGATYLFAFLNVATTNLYSTALAKSNNNGGKNNNSKAAAAESVVQTASRVAMRCGLGLMVFLLVLARPLLALYIGHEVDNTPGLLDAAVDYVKIRAFSMPTSLLLGVVQAALLGAKDSVTPLIAILYSTIVNVIGDYILVQHFNMGLRGAAIATLLAQWAATAALLGPARKRLIQNGSSLGVFQKPPVTQDSVTGRTFLGFAAPVLTLILGKLAAFGFMTHSAAAVPGQPTPLASHQIILSLFFFVSPFMEVISQTAQTFMPPYLAPAMDRVAQKTKTDKNYQPSQDTVVQPWLNAAFSVGNSLLQLGFVMATIVASAAALIPAYFGGVLTSDSTVKNAVKPLAKYLFAGAFLTAPVAVSEGILLARRELKYLAMVYVLSTALLPPALIRVKVLGGNVEQVWACFAVFQMFRALFFAGRIWSGSVWNAIFGGRNDVFGSNNNNNQKAKKAAT